MIDTPTTDSVSTDELPEGSADQHGDLPGAGRRLRGDRGAADIGIEILFGAVVMIALFLFLIEATGYWHARNILDDAAAEGARVAAAFDGTCAQAENTARHRITERAGGWASGAAVTCSETNGIVTVVITSTTPGLLSSSTGYRATVTESTPKEQ